MKEYKVVNLNKNVKLFRDNDLKQTEDTINEYVSAGWELQQIISPSDLGGAMVGIFYREKN